MEWTNIFITGIDHIDKQHKELFNTIIKFKKAEDNGETTKDILKYLVNYAIEHFRTEEEYMKNMYWKRTRNNWRNNEIK